MGQRNAVEALLRHDWAHRWREILAVAGIEPSSKMASRLKDLTRLADAAAAADEQVSDARQAVEHP
jgi:hypothetical protein